MACPQPTEQFVSRALSGPHHRPRRVQIGPHLIDVTAERADRLTAVYLAGAQSGDHWEVFNEAQLLGYVSERDAAAYDREHRRIGTGLRFDRAVKLVVSELNGVYRHYLAELATV
jgi:hypothetical protein